MATQISKFLFPIFWLAVMLLYLPTYGAGFVTDFLGWQLLYDDGAFKDVWHCYGYPALHQVLYFLFFLIYKTFGTAALPWFLIFTALHALNGFLLFKIVQQLHIKHRLNHAFRSSLAVAILFLISPYAAEVVVWRVCLHYLMVTSFIFSAVWFLFKYLDGEKNKLGLIYLFFLLGLFSLELGLMTPFILLGFFLIYSKNYISKFWKTVFIPQIILLIGYFGLNKLAFGAIVGHYGAETHLNFDIGHIIANGFKYLTKYLGLVRYYPHKIKLFIFDGFTEPKVWLPFLILFSLFFFIAIINFKKLSIRIRTAGLSLLLFFIALAPIANLYFSTILHGENDRYGYLASAFFFLSIVMLLQALAKRFSIGKYFITILFFGYFGASFFYLLKTNTYWHHSKNVFNGLMNDFRWYDKEEVFVLGIPDNFQGVYLYRIMDSPSGLDEALRVQRKKPFEGKIYDIVQYNMDTPKDAFKVRVEEPDLLHVEFNQWGNWWWRKGVGAGGFNDDRHEMRLDGHTYKLRIKNRNPNAVYIYQVGDKWEEVVFDDEIK